MTSHPGLGGMPIYLDYNATTPVDPRVAEAVLPYLTVHFGNPSSDHVFAEAPRDALATARGQLAALLRAPVEGIVFTGSGSEADNLAIAGVMAARGGGHVVIQTTEHPAVLQTCQALARSGDIKVSYAPVDSYGIVQPEALSSVITHETTLVSIMHANNETGVIQPIAALARIAHAHGALMHTDAAQSVGKIPVRIDDLDVDLLTVAGHKLYAPKGVGALYVRPGTDISAIIHGGGQEGARRAGTENVALICALSTAAQIAHDNLPSEPARLRRLRDRLHQLLEEHLPGRVRLNGHPTDRLPNTLNVSIDGVAGQSVLATTPGVAASTGSACHSGHATPSPVLTAMGHADQRALGAIRLSVGRFTTDDDVERAAGLLATGAGQ